MEAKKRGQGSSETLPKESPKEDTVKTAMPFNLDNVDPEKMRMAEDFGIPVRALLEWANSVEARFDALDDKLPKAIGQAMNVAVEKARIRQMAEMKKLAGGQPTTAGGGETASLVKELIGFLKGGGGGGDSEMVQLSKDLVRAQIDNIKTDMGFSKALKEAITRRMAQKATEGIGV